MPITYYEMKKHMYKQRYRNAKIKEEENRLLYEKYGGERKYYKQRLIDLGFLEIIPHVPVVGLEEGVDVVGGAGGATPVVAVEAD